ncbi:uncharacterized protein E0L32_008050 [Thyridium curvatum]|uniref:Uncharacterized protein n=1 Tax=Thyridium curvatum TaxID=1093900 RepID=A0A507ATE3_9PEZI|nr:uncharacterized protein E0L32_008050 [Thyridium curvatum]TPX11013.1 hypothetical protein E0L32_008050 [Thyridium curvatum]
MDLGFVSPLAVRATVPLKEPLGGRIVSIILNLASLTVLAIFLIIFGIYIDSYVFVFATGLLLFGFSIDRSTPACDAAILLCLCCYVSTKIAIYLFLVEKAHIVRGSRLPRLKSKLYIFNSFGMLGIYGVVVVLNFVFRISKQESGVCVIGMQKGAMIPLISFDIVVNVYLTILFLIPLSSMYSFRNKKTQLRPTSARLRTVAIRTFVGCLCTLTSSIVNLSVLMILEGEPGWICLMCCNSDILFSAIVLQWVTSKDNAASSRTPGHTDMYYAQQQPPTLEDAASSVVAAAAAAAAAVPSAVMPCPSCRAASIAAGAGSIFPPPPPPSITGVNHPYYAAGPRRHSRSCFASAMAGLAGGGSSGRNKAEPEPEPAASEISRTLSVEVLHEPAAAAARGGGGGGGRGGVATNEVHISAVGRGSVSSLDGAELERAATAVASTAASSSSSSPVTCCGSHDDDEKSGEKGDDRVSVEEREEEEGDDDDDDENVIVDEEAPRTVLHAPPPRRGR